ncbi:MAG TPA: hypothetical protein VF247_02460, partial [Candidatus Krumholzibacteria bacterium]
EDRWDIDGGDIDSWSTRLNVELPRRWSVQASYGDLHEPEAIAPGDVQRTTASLQYNESGEGPFAFMLLWGRNDEDHGVSNSLLLEGARQFDRKQLFARIEWVEKDEQLLLTREHVDGSDIPLADVTAFTLGYFHTGRIFDGLGMGGDVTVYAVPSSLQDTYGDFPVSLHVFIRARWMAATGGHHH